MERVKVNMDAKDKRRFEKAAKLEGRSLSAWLLRAAIKALVVEVAK